MHRASQADAVDTVIVGAGQAGLATSYCLTEQRRAHVVLDRGRVGDRWFTERWDSLRLLTPNWMVRLPGWTPAVRDPDDYLAARTFGELLSGYAASFDAPVREGTTVLAVRPADGRFHVVTSQQDWLAASVVVATGHCDLPALPPMAGRLPGGIVQVTTARYTSPSALPPGGVLVVGASASGVQIAHELAVTGRQVTVSVGRHSRLPRTYRGMDILWWLDALGLLDRNIDEVGDVTAARREPSLQLAGRATRTSLDLPSLERRGARLTGRLVGVDGHRLSFADDLGATTGAAEARLSRVLDAIDDYAERSRIDREVLPADRPRAFAPRRAPSSLDLRSEGISTVIWATGYRREYPWLQVPVLGRDGEIVQRAGITSVPGVYTVGQRFQTRRRSTFIDGVGHDADVVAAHINALRPTRAATGVLTGRQP